MCVCMYVYVYIYIYIYTVTYIHTYTYTHHLAICRNHVHRPGAPGRRATSTTNNKETRRLTTSKTGARLPQPAAGLRNGQDRRAGVRGTAAAERCIPRGNHLSNTTCLMQVFFKSGQECIKLWCSLTRRKTRQMRQGKMGPWLNGVGATLAKVARMTAVKSVQMIIFKGIVYAALMPSQEPIY